MWRVRSGKNRDWPGEPPRARAPLLRRPALLGSWRWSAAPLAPQARRMEARIRRFGLAGRARSHAAANQALCNPSEHIGERPWDVLPQETLIRVPGKTCRRKARKNRVVPVGFEREKEIEEHMKRHSTSRGSSSRAAGLTRSGRGDRAVKLASCAALLAAAAAGHLFSPYGLAASAGLRFFLLDSRRTRKADSNKLITSISGRGEHRCGVGCGQSHAVRCGSDR